MATFGRNACTTVSPTFHDSSFLRRLSLPTFLIAKSDPLSLNRNLQHLGTGVQTIRSTSKEIRMALALLNECIKISMSSALVASRSPSTGLKEVIQHFSELFRLDQPGWTFPGWGCGSFGKKTADMVEDVVDCGGVPIGAKLQPVQSTAHSRLVCPS